MTAKHTSRAESDFLLMQQAEDEVCERTISRLREHAEAMSVTFDRALEDVIPDTKKRLISYMERKAIAERDAKGFLPFKSAVETHDKYGGTTGAPLPGYAR